MENNIMNVLYEYFGEEKKDDQEMLSISNIFYEMGNEKAIDKAKELIENERDKV